MNEEKLQLFKDSMKMVASSVTKKEFIDAFSKVLAIIKDVKDTNVREWNAIHTAVQNLSNKIKADTSSDLAEIKKQVNDVFVRDRMDEMKNSNDTQIKSLSTKIDQKLKEVDVKLKSVKNGKDGKDGRDGKDGYTPIKGKDYFDGKDGQKGERGSAFAPRSNNSTRFYDLSSKTNGSLKVFTVPKGLSAVVFCSDFPTVLMEGNGFTLNASRTQLTLTTSAAPTAGSQLLYQYVSQFNLA